MFRIKNTLAKTSVIITVDKVRTIQRTGRRLGQTCLKSAVNLNNLLMPLSVLEG